MTHVNALSHQLWKLMTSEPKKDMKWIYDNGASQFFYRTRLEKLFEEKGIEGVAEAMYNIAASSYTVQRNIEGLVELGYSEEEAHVECDDYSQEIADLENRISNEYDNEIQEYRIALDKRYEEASMDNEDLKYDEGANYVDSSYTAKHPHKIDIPQHHIQYTSYFHYFLQRREGYRYTRTQLLNIEYALKHAIRTKKKEVFPFLALVIGTTRTKNILGVGKGSHKILTPDVGLLKVSRKVQARLRREQRKFYYQLYKDKFKEYYHNLEYEEKVDEAYLEKYNCLEK